MLSNAGLNISSVNSLGTRLRTLAVLEALELDSILNGRSKVFSQGQTTFSLSVGDTRSVGLLLRCGIYGSYSMPSNWVCSFLNILYSILIGVCAVKGLTRVKKMREASVCICRLCAVVTVLRADHFLLKFLTSRRKIVFSAVNSRDAVHSMRDSILCSILDSSACMLVLAFNSFDIMECEDFSDTIEVVEVNESVSPKEELEFGRLRELLAASRSGIRMSTC